MSKGSENQVYLDLLLQARIGRLTRRDAMRCVAGSRLVYPAR